MAKPKAKTEEQKNAELEMMLSEAATSSHLTSPTSNRTDKATSATLVEDSPAPQQQSPAAISGNQEQKGEKALAALSNEAATPASPEPAPTPVAETTTPAQASQPAPAVEPRATAPAPAPAQVTPPVVAHNEESSPKVEDATDGTPDQSPTIEVGSLDLTALFAPSAEKKVNSIRLTDANYQYLLMVGTIVGNGTSVPDIVHNLVTQFIEKNDALIQKAIAKQLRQRKK